MQGCACPTIYAGLSFRACNSALLSDGSQALPGAWVLYVYAPHAGALPARRVGRIIEILQAVGTLDAQQGKASILCIQPAIIGEIHEKYHMRKLTPLEPSFAISTSIQVFPAHLFIVGKI